MEKTMKGFKSKDGRKVEYGQVVEVYFNLHNNMFSIRDKKTNKVLGYANAVIVEDVIYKVSETLRQRVLREQRKNVHALVVGKFVAALDEMPSEYKAERKGYYNPYKTDKFLDMETKEPLFKSNAAFLFEKQFTYR